MSAVGQQHDNLLQGSHANLSEYNVGAGCLYLFCSFPPYSWFLGPCLHCRVQSQEIFFEDSRLHFKYDCCIQKADKLIPLDRIQDINIEANCFSRLCGVDILNIQTANGSQLPEAIVFAPVNAQSLRSTIMDRRDRIVHGAQPGSLGSTGLDGLAKPIIASESLSNESKQELHEMGRSLNRIEQLLERGLLKLEQMQR